MKRGLIFGTDSAGRAAALNVITLTDCWQVVHYPRCIEDEAQPRTDRKCNCGGRRMLGGADIKRKTKLGCDCCLRPSRFFCCDVPILILWSWIDVQGLLTWWIHWLQSLRSVLMCSWRDAICRMMGSGVCLTNTSCFIKTVFKNV